MNQPHLKHKKILHVVASLRGGAAEHILYLLDYFGQRGHEMYLVAPDDCQATGDKLRTLKNKVHWTPLPLDRRFYPAGAKQIADILVQEKIDLIHTHGIRAGHYGRKAVSLARKAGATLKSVYTVHGFHPAYYTNPILKQVALYLERKHFQNHTDLVIFVSEADKNLFQNLLKINPELLEMKSEVIHNGIQFPSPEQLPNKNEARARMNVSPDAFVVGTLSRLNRQKAVHLLVEAAALLRNSIPNLQILIAGDGPLQSKLETLAKKLNVSDKIRFLGYYSDNLAFYSALDCFVLSSLWEGLPLVLLEAGSLGLPMVASRVAGTIEVLEEDKTGLLFESGNTEEFAHQIERMYKEPKPGQWLGEKAKKIIPERFSLEKMLEKTARAYENLETD